jgi:hypothetical protein
MKQPRKNRPPYKQRDVTRLMRGFEAGGKEVTGAEIVTKDGVTIRVFGKGAAPVVANPWDEVLKTDAADEKRAP